MKPTGKRYFVTGLLVILPALLTIYLFVTLFAFFDNILGRYISKLTESSFGIHIPGLGLLVFILLIFLVGIFATNLIGRRIIAYFESVWFKFPLIRSVYPALKQITRFLFSHQFEEGFQRVALLEYPRKGIWILCFVTNQTGVYFTQKLKGEEYCNVLVPTVPSPVTGVYVLALKKEMIFLDLSIEEAMKLIVSGGVLNPRDLMKNQD